MKRKRIRIYTSYKSKNQCSVVFEITYLQYKLLLMEKRKNKQLRGNSSFTKDSLKFAENHDEAIHLQIRRA